MEYRGKSYLVIQGTEPNSWKWSVNLDSETTKSGEAKSRGDAVTKVVMLIDQALAKRVETDNTAVATDDVSTAGHQPGSVQ
jgi:hypothetical protein